jgi:hypothetical protein
MAAVVAAGAVVYREFTIALPPVAQLLDYRPPAVSRVFAADGTVIGEFYIEKRYVLPIYRIPELVQLAFLAAEDASFYQHRGIDPVGIVRAAIYNYRAGGTRQGGSTITQQVVKSLLLTPERSYERKLKELVLAIRLERELTKAEILSLYLNQIYLGNGAYGVQAASREYFDKDVADLGLAEAALLAGLPQAPSRYSPLRHLDRAKARQRYVLAQMVEDGFVTREEAKSAEETPIELKPGESDAVGPAPYFVSTCAGRSSLATAPTRPTSSGSTSTHPSICGCRRSPRSSSRRECAISTRGRGSGGRSARRARVSSRRSERVPRARAPCLLPGRSSKSSRPRVRMGAPGVLEVGSRSTGTAASRSFLRRGSNGRPGSTTIHSRATSWRFGSSRGGRKDGRSSSRTRTTLRERSWPWSRPQAT